MKGKLEEAYAKARFTEGNYRIQYRDYKELIDLPLKEFEKIAEIVPTHRIARILEKVEKVEDPDISYRSDSLYKVIYQSFDEELLKLPTIVKEVVDEETMRFVEMRDALGQKYPWQRYIELECVKRLEEEGRELLGEIVYVFPKRDGENVSLWLEENVKVEPEKKMIHVSSHNMVNADPKMIYRVSNTPEYPNALELLRSEWMNFGKNLVLYGELVNKGKGPTRIEPAHKYAHWYLFDIYDIDAKSYLPYTLVYQMAYHYKLSLVEATETFTPWKMEDLSPKIEEWKTWAKRHKREGVVGKVYKNGRLIGFKEKIDLPDLPPIPRNILEKATFPPMPEDRILRALQHSWDELMSSIFKETAIKDERMVTPAQRLYFETKVWQDKARAMPIIAKHIATEGREHHFSPPKNIFEIYLNTDIAKIREHPNAV